MTRAELMQATLLALSTPPRRMEAPPPPQPAYLTFSSPGEFTIRVDDRTKHWDGTLEYSTDAQNWAVWDGTTTLSSVGGYLYMRGTGNTIITGTVMLEPGHPQWRSVNFVMTGSNVSCSGNIEYLLDYATVENGEHPAMGFGCFGEMFEDCRALISAPELPATSLTEWCYWSMFLGTAITTPPELPATTLAEGCYFYMFGWSSITAAPELPAMTLAEYCYSGMFYDCYSLTTAPELPATTLAEYCYYHMFEECTALTTAPELPAMVMERYCYGSMFSTCTSLTTPPALPATTLAELCYDCMFAFNPALLVPPELPATTLEYRCYGEMFNGCTSLSALPKLPATALTDYCYSAMFRGCSSIKLSTTGGGEYLYEYRIPTSGAGTEALLSIRDMFEWTGGTFTGTPAINTTYYTTNPPV